MFRVTKYPWLENDFSLGKKFIKSNIICAHQCALNMIQHNRIRCTEIQREICIFLFFSINIYNFYCEERLVISRDFSCGQRLAIWINTNFCPGFNNSSFLHQKENHSFFLISRQFFTSGCHFGCIDGSNLLQSSL